MTMWIELLENDKAIKHIFKKSPQLTGVKLYEINVREVEPQLILRLDLNEYPESPPKKWERIKANTVQIKLGLSEVSDLVMANWSVDNIVDIKFTPSGSGFLLQIDGSCNFSCKAQHITLNDISAYQNALD